MSIEPELLAGFGAIGAVVAVLWRKFEASHAECIKERKECHEERRELIDHNIAQQHDIRTLMRGESVGHLQSERTQFFEKHIKGGS